MNLPKLMAKHLREVYFGGNWTASCLKETVSDVNWKEATLKIHSFNTIGALVYHINYYERAILSVLELRPFEFQDKFSFDLPPIQASGDWENLLTKTWDETERLAVLIEQLPGEIMGKTFVQEKYGDYYRNFQGLIEHTHYHLGQIVLIKKLIRASA